MQGQLGVDPKKPLITLETSEDQKTVHVYLGFLHYEAVPNDPASFQYRHLVARFAITGFPIAALSRVFGFSGPTIRHFKEVVANASDDQEMFVRLRGYNRQKTKLTSEIEAYLKARFGPVYAVNRGSYNRQLRQEVQKHFQVKLSPEALRQVIAPLRREIDDKAQAAKKATPEKLSSLSPNRNAQPQEIAVAPILGEDALRTEMDNSAFEMACLPRAAANAEVAEINVAAVIDSPAPRVAESTPQAMIGSSQPDAEKGQHYLHAGLLVLNLWLADFAKGFTTRGGVLLQWLYQIFAGAVNFERARYLHRHEFSRFLGRAAAGVSKSRAR
jgi:hypothetical protein